MPDSREKKAKHWLTKINPDELSVVVGDSVQPCVPDATIAFVKALQSGEAVSDEIPFAVNLEIAKYDEKRGIIFFKVAVPDIPDLEGDVITKEDVEEAAYAFMKNLSEGLHKGTGVGLNHRGFSGIGYPVASYVDTSGAVQKFEWNLPDDQVRKGAWIGAIQLTDEDLKKKAATGELKGISMGGRAVRVPVDKSIFGKAGDLFTALLSKETGGEYSSDFETIYVSTEVYEKLPAMIDALFASIAQIVSDDTVPDKKDAVSATINQFRNKLIPLLAASKSEVDKVNFVLKAVLDSASAITQTATEDMTKIEPTANGGQKEEEIMPQIEKEFEELSEDVRKLRKGSKDVTEAIEDIQKTQKKLLDRLEKWEQVDVQAADGQVRKMDTHEILNLLVDSVAKLTDNVTALSKAVTGSRGVDPEYLQKKAPDDKTEGEETRKSTSSLDGTIFDGRAMMKLVGIGEPK